MKKKEVSLFSLLAFLDWRRILRYAIKSRPSSWTENPVIEWRNASDCVFSGLIAELERAGVDPYSSKVKVVKSNEAK